MDRESTNNTPYSRRSRVPYRRRHSSYRRPSQGGPFEDRQPSEGRQPSEDSQASGDRRSSPDRQSSPELPIDLNETGRNTPTNGHRNGLAMLPLVPPIGPVLFNHLIDAASMNIAGSVGSQRQFAVAPDDNVDMGLYHFQAGRSHDFNIGEHSAGSSPIPLFTESDQSPMSDSASSWLTYPGSQPMSQTEHVSSPEITDISESVAWPTNFGSALMEEQPGTSGGDKNEKNVEKDKDENKKDEDAGNKKDEEKEKNETDNLIIPEDINNSQGDSTGIDIFNVWHSQEDVNTGPISNIIPSVQGEEDLIRINELETRMDFSG